MLENTTESVGFLAYTFKISGISRKFPLKTFPTWKVKLLVMRLTPLTAQIQKNVWNLGMLQFSFINNRAPDLES